jgi:hypothetical protein
MDDIYTKHRSEVVKSLRMIADFLDSENSEGTQVDACIVMRSPVPGALEKHVKDLTERPYMQPFPMDAETKTIWKVGDPYEVRNAL